MAIDAPGGYGYFSSIPLESRITFLRPYPRGFIHVSHVGRQIREVLEVSGASPARLRLRRSGYYARQYVAALRGGSAALEQRRPQEHPDRVNAHRSQLEPGGREGRLTITQ
jgi:hypothetical protein